MKRIIAYALLVALVFNIFAINVFATDTDNPISIVVSGEKAASEAENKGNVTIKITSTAGKDLLIKILDVADNNKIIYLETVLGTKNDTTVTGDGTADKTVKITNVVLKKEVIGAKEFKIIVSESSAAKEFTFENQLYTGGGTTGGNITNSGCSKCGMTPCVCGQEWEKDIVVDGTSVPADVPDENYTVIAAAANVGSIKDAEKFITWVTNATDKTAMYGEAARNTVAMSVEAMISNIASKRIGASSSTNQLVLKESSISDTDLKKYTDAETALNSAMNKNKIALNRSLTREYVVNTTFSTKQKATITIYKAFITKLESIGIETLTINDKNFRVSYSLSELKGMIGDKEFIKFDIDTTVMSNSTKKLAVNFDTDKTQSVKISFPGLGADAKYTAIVDENGNPVGGRYNPATGAIEAKISESGVYQVVNNEKDFEDIKHLSDEMQESIKILAAKGIIEGTSAKEFSPEDSISRAEVAALLLRVLSQVDPNADGGFADIKKSDWFYGTAGSAKAYGMIQGFPDNTFRGNATIAKDQILTIASRVLQREMKYIAPEKPEDWLTFADASSIASWATNDIALTTMANIITRSADNTIHANENMTRGDAALIIMRLFYKIW